MCRIIPLIYTSLRRASAYKYAEICQRSPAAAGLLMKGLRGVLNYLIVTDYKKCGFNGFMAMGLLIKAGVEISRLNRPIRRALNKLVLLWAGRGQSLVITSTYEGNHSPSSLHYANDAIDVRYPAGELKTLKEVLRSKLGPDFDIVFEKTHIHIEYDPK